MNDSVSKDKSESEIANEERKRQLCPIGVKKMAKKMSCFGLVCKSAFYWLLGQSLNRQLKPNTERQDKPELSHWEADSRTLLLRHWDTGVGLRNELLSAIGAIAGITNIAAITAIPTIDISYWD